MPLQMERAGRFQVFITNKYMYTIYIYYMYKRGICICLKFMPKYNFLFRL